MFLSLQESSSHPDLRGHVAATASQIEIQGTTFPVTADQVEVLKQRTFTGAPNPNTGEGTSAKITSCFALIRGLPPEESIALMLMLARQREPGDEFVPTMHKAGSIPDPPAFPYYDLSLNDPRLGLAIGVKVDHPHIRYLRAELPGGVVIEDTVSKGCLLLLVPYSSPKKWPFDESTKFRIVDENREDFIKPPPFPRFS